MTAQARLLGGRYQVGELLGYGGMAEVHRGRDLRLGRDVAIKMLRTDLARDATFQMRFRREAQNAASLNHPAIVAVYDTGEETGPTGETLPFIVMEFVNGRTLKEVLAAEGRLQPRRAMEITADMCAALEFSHRHGIIHRDIKPGNVMLTANGAVKVMDFGIARALASGATTMTQTSAVIGTAQYLSPEQARGEAVDARSDVYAAGCVLFELLCGHPPFVGDSPVSVAYQHVREDPPTPSDINRDVTPPIDAIVLKALSKNPLNRYQSAGEMRADLLRAAAGRPVTATPVLREDPGATMAAPTQVRPAGVNARPAAGRAPDRRQRSGAWLMAVLSALAVFAVIAVAVVTLMNRNAPKPVAVPPLTGMTIEQARAELSKNGFKLAQGPNIRGNCIKDRVADQDPKPPAKVDPLKNPNVTVSICEGQQKVKVPDNLVGGTYDFAVGRLKELGLQVKRQDVASDKAEGQVVDIDPQPGTELERGQTVTVKVSEGTVRVTSVIGQTEASARDELAELGFKVEVKDGRLVPPDQAGKVSKQDPEAGTALKTGSKVTIFVDRPLVSPSPDVSPVSPPPTGLPSTSPGTGGGVIPSIRTPRFP
jgi:serine/threonine-protein kinase